MSKQHIEHKIRRLTGMTAEARDAMHAANAKCQWRVRCKCGHWTVADYDQILKLDCINCGLPLGKRV